MTTRRIRHVVVPPLTRRVRIGREAVAFLADPARCPDTTVEAFVLALCRVDADPATHSIPVRRPALSRHMLRVFSFGAHAALIRWDPGEGSITVMDCTPVEA